MSELPSSAVWEAGMEAPGDYVCLSCGEPATVMTVVPECPACGGRLWSRSNTCWSAHTAEEAHAGSPATRDDVCLPIVRLAAGAKTGWSAADLLHLRSCTACRGVLATGWHMGDLTPAEISRHDESRDLVAHAVADHAHADGCPDCERRLAALRPRSELRRSVRARTWNAVVRDVAALFVGTSSVRSFVRRALSVTTLVALDLGGALAGILVGTAVVGQVAGEASVVDSVNASREWLTYVGGTLLAVFWWAKLYRRREERPGSRRVTSAAFFVALLLSIALLASGEAGRPLAVLAVSAIVGAVLVVAARSVYERATARALRAVGVRRRVLLVGPWLRVVKVVEALGAQRSGIAYDVIGYVTTDDSPAPTSAEGVPLVGTREELAAVLHEHEPFEVIVAAPELMFDRRLALRETFTEHNRTATFQAKVFTPSWSYDYTLNEPLTLEQIQPRVFTPSQWRLKRTVDLALSLSVLVLLSPIWIAVAAVTALATGGRVLRRDDRIGRMGRPYRMLRFAGTLDAIEEGARLYRLRRLWFRILQRTRLVDVPLLVNVVRGQMSIVGPRPLDPAEYPRRAAEASVRELVLPGITGLCQISGATERARTVGLDRYYVMSWSGWLDAEILLKSGLVLILNKDVPVDRERSGTGRI